jgi:hypothetical protein
MCCERWREIMTDTAADGAAVPEGLVSAVVNLVNTGPVLLGAYTAAELAAVDAIVDFLEARPAADVLAEAVRSLAARQLLVPGSAGQQVQVRGDLAIAVVPSACWSASTRWACTNWGCTRLTKPSVW